MWNFLKKYIYKYSRFIPKLSLNVFSPDTAYTLINFLKTLNITWFFLLLKMTRCAEVILCEFAHTTAHQEGILDFKSNLIWEITTICYHIRVFPFEKASFHWWTLCFVYRFTAFVILWRWHVRHLIFLSEILLKMKLVRT